MDEKKVEQLLHMLILGASQPQGYSGPMYDAGMSTHGYGPDANPFAYTTNESSSFFGPIGNLIGAMFPEMMVEDDSGQMVFPFKTNLTLRNSGRSGFSNMVTDSNTRAYNHAVADSWQPQAEGWRKATSTDGVLGKLAQAALGEENGSALMSFLGSDIGAKIGLPIVNQALGYDRGASANVATGRSLGVVAGMQGLYGGTMFGDEQAPRSMGMLDALTGFTDKDSQVATQRDAVAGLISSTTNSMMYDGIVKRQNMHGASEALVGNIIADAIQNGSLDKMLQETGFTGEGLDGKDQSAGNMRDILTNRGNVVREMKTLEARRKEDVEKYKEAQERGDTDAQSQLESEIKDADQRLEEAAKQLKEIDGLVEKAATPLVEAVTGVTSALKDFYGSETESKAALDKLTNGQGSHDKAVADRVHDQVNEIKLLGTMAGIDPRIMGTQLMEVNGALGGGSRLGSRVSGATALNFQNMFARQLFSLGGSTNDKADLMDAQVSRAASYGQSEGSAFATLLEVAKKNGAFAGNEDQLSEIVDMAKTGRREDFLEAKKRLAKLGFGSEEFYEEIANDPEMLAKYASKLTDQERDSAGKLGVQMAQAEDSRMLREGGRNAKQRRLEMALQESGVSVSEIDNAVGGRDYQAIMDQLEGMTGGENMDEGASAAREMMQREFQAAKDKGMSDEEARRVAAENFTAKGYDKLLSDDNRNKIEDTRAASRFSALRDLEYFKDENGNRFALEGNDFLKSVGAVSEDGTLTRSALSQASNSMFDTITQYGDTFRTKDGGKIDMAEIAKKRDQFDKLMKEGKGEEAYALFNEIAGSLDESSQKVLQRSLKGSYRTTDQIYNESVSRLSEDDQKVLADNRAILNDPKKSRKEKEEAQAKIDELMAKSDKEQDLIDRVAGYGDMGKKMAGMNRDDQLAYAEAVEKSQNTNISEEERDKARKEMREYEKKAESASMSDLEKIVQAFQNNDPTKFAEALKAAGTTVEQFQEAIKKVVEAIGGTVSGPEDASAAASTGQSDETWYHSGKKGERNWAGAILSSPFRLLKGASDGLFGDDSILSNALGMGVAAVDYATGNGEAMEGAQSRITGVSSTRQGRDGSGVSGAKIDALCGRLDELISTMKTTGQDKTVRL